MLQLKLSKSRFFNETTEEFINFEPVTIKLEHSLISIQKWEAKWHKSFLSSEHTAEEMLDYFRCMSLDPNIDPNFTLRLTQKEINQIQEYMQNPMTATTFGNQRPQVGPNRIVTAEIIYYWMTGLNIPFDCAKWHINQLMTLIKVCSIKSNPQKMSKKEAGAQRAALNKARRAQLGSSG
jgi:hypothetical protein